VPSQPEVLGSAVPGVCSLLSQLLWPTGSPAVRGLGTHTVAETASAAETSLAVFALLLGCPKAWSLS